MILTIPQLKDNYSYLLVASDLSCVVIDPSEAAPVEQAIQAQGLKLQAILYTHHHHDHVGGGEELRARFKAPCVGPIYDQARLRVDVSLSDQEIATFAGFDFKILHIPGHTLGSIAYFAPKEQWLFCGDTLFSLGCGKVFEGTPEMMLNSLRKLSSLPGSTEIYCGHEYTLSNAEFALWCEPGNLRLKQKIAKCKELRLTGVPTVPSLLQDELECNPFLHTSSPTLRHRLGLSRDEPDAQVFQVLRALKDQGAHLKSENFKS